MSLFLTPYVTTLGWHRIAHMSKIVRGKLFLQAILSYWKPGLDIFLAQIHVCVRYSKLILAICDRCTSHSRKRKGWWLAQLTCCPHIVGMRFEHYTYTLYKMLACLGESVVDHWMKNSQWYKKDEVPDIHLRDIFVFNSTQLFNISLKRVRKHRF